MSIESCGKEAVEIRKATTSQQISMVVDGCKIKLNFPPKSEKDALNDVKRMMLGGSVKT